MSEPPRQPGEEAPEGSKPAPSARYPLIVGLAFVALIAYATYNSIQTDEGGLLGAEDAERGRALPEFAVPDIRSGLEGDANVFQDDCDTSQNPCPEDARRVPACRIDEPRAIRVCDLFDKPLAISFWFTGGAACLEEQDAFNRAYERYRDEVNFLSVNIRDEIGDVRRIVEERNWSVPVGWDRDGAVSNTYRVGLCPTMALAFPGGILDDAFIGTDSFSEEALSREIERLIRESRERAAAIG
jgi:thiol-disulfide isomerase/thioredoxin